MPHSAHRMDHVWVCNIIGAQVQSMVWHMEPLTLCPLCVLPAYIMEVKLTHDGTPECRQSQLDSNYKSCIGDLGNLSPVKWSLACWLVLLIGQRKSWKPQSAESVRVPTRVRQWWGKHQASLVMVEFPGVSAGGEGTWSRMTARKASLLNLVHNREAVFVHI